MITSQLLLAKRLFIESEAYVDREDPVSGGIAISMLQDAVELYVWSLIKERGIQIKDQSSFTTNIEALQKAGVPLPDAARLLELNKARVGFKHYGNLPAPEEAKKFRGYAEGFLRSAMREHFQVAFDQLSMVALIADPEVSMFLVEAEAHLTGSDASQAMGELSKAKAVLFSKLGSMVPRVPAQIKDADRALQEPNLHPFALMALYLDQLRDSLLISMLRLRLEDHRIISLIPTAQQSVSGKWYLTLHANYTDDFVSEALKCLVALAIRVETLGPLPVGLAGSKRRRLDPKV